MRAKEVRDEFLSEEDLSLKELSDEELYEYWELWLLQAQASNDFDRRHYSHGVFIEAPECDRSEAEPQADDSTRP